MQSKEMSHLTTCYGFIMWCLATDGKWSIYNNAQATGLVSGTLISNS